MYTNDVFEALKGYAVESVGKSGNVCMVTIGNCGRNMDQRRIFKAAKFETVIRQIKKKYGEMPDYTK